jgi:MinD-like ATPase involved in chromosome partitioning or flagellar assembly
MGTKGGVGKSTVAMGVAAWLSKVQSDLVLLVDGDIHVRTVELKMAPRTDITFAQVLEGKYDLVDAIYRCQLKSRGRWLYPQLSILPAGARFLPPGARDIVKFVADTVERFEPVMKRLRDYFSYIIIDTPPSVTFEHFILTSVADALFFVVTPDVGSIFSSKQTAIGLEEMMGIKPLGVIMNKVPIGLPNLRGWTDYASEVAPLIGTIEYDDLLDEAFKRNLPVVAAYPRATSSLAMKKIARKLLKLEVPPTDMLSKFKRAWKKAWEDRRMEARYLKRLSKILRKPPPPT